MVPLFGVVLISEEPLIQCSFSSKSISGKNNNNKLVKLVKNQVKYKACYQLDMAFGVFSDQLIGSLGIGYWPNCTLDSLQQLVF